ncbi:MAG: hypothetical protein PW843_02770 [Azospirillaceae bacterium]|nr:hypothetical protein [Azospirillaceae bacterium]
MDLASFLDLVVYYTQPTQPAPCPVPADWSYATPPHLAGGGSVSLDLTAGRVWVRDCRREGDFPLAQVAVQPIRPADLARPEALAQMVIWAGEPVPWRFRIPCGSWRQARTVTAELSLLLDRAATDMPARCLSF